MLLRYLVAGAFALFASANLYSAPITYGFSGSVTQVPADDPGGGIAFGSVISGTYTFDDTASDAIADITQSSYASFGPDFGMSVLIGSINYDLSGYLNISISNNVGGMDQYGAFTFDGSLSIAMLFEDLDATVFSSDLLSLLPPDITAFDLRSFHLSDTSLGDVQIDGQIDSLVCLQGCVPNPIPEPGTLLLVLTGLLAGGLRRRLTS